MANQPQDLIMFLHQMLFYLKNLLDKEKRCQALYHHERSFKCDIKQSILLL